MRDKKRHVNTALRRRPQKDETRLRKKRPKIRMGTKPEKDQRRDHLPLDAVMIEPPEKTLPRLHQMRERKIRDEDTKAYGEQKERLVLLTDG